jgi:hypothetical protein
MANTLNNIYIYTHLLSLVTPLPLLMEVWNEVWYLQSLLKTFVHVKWKFKLKASILYAQMRNTLITSVRQPEIHIHKYHNIKIDTNP